MYQLVRPDMLYIDHEQVHARNNPYVRAVGFLFIRFLAPPEQLWDRLHMFLFEDQKATQFTHSSDRSSTITIGAYVQRLLSDKAYFNTVLPRVPVLLQREILRKILTLAERRSLRDTNEERSGEFYQGQEVQVRVDGWDSPFVDAVVTKAHFRAPFQAYGLDDLSEQDEEDEG